MKCNEIRSFFYDYADGTVDEATRSSIENHLSGCTACRLHYETQRRLHQSVTDAVANELAGLHFKSMSVKAALSGGYAPTRISLWGQPRAIAASCLIVLCTTICVLWKHMSGPADAPAPSAYAEAYHCLEMYRAGGSSASGFSTPLAVIIQPGAPARVIELDGIMDVSAEIH
jgi:hypothetical protein